MKRTFAATVLAAGALLTLTACSDTPADEAKAAGMTDEQVWACQDFIDGKDEISAEDRQGKMDFARKVNEWAQKAGPEFKDGGDILARSSQLDAKAWQVGIDTFAYKCINAGWPTGGE